MSKKIYVGNMNYATTEDNLRELFGQFGGVESVAVIVDRATGRAKGFGFVEMESDEAAQAAIQALDGQEHEASFGSTRLRRNRGTLLPGITDGQYRRRIQPERRGDSQESPGQRRPEQRSCLVPRKTYQEFERVEHQGRAGKALVRPPVDGVAEDRAAKVPAMHAELVGTPGPRPQDQQRVGAC